MNYFEIDEFKGIYLEDSFLLSLELRLDLIEIRMDFVILEDHPEYQLPKENEYHSYRKGKIIFTKFSKVELSEIRAVPIIGLEDEEDDYGNIDFFQINGSEYKLGGEWGNMTVYGGNVAIKLDADKF